MSIAALRTARLHKRLIIEMRNKVCLPESASPNSGILVESNANRLVNLSEVVDCCSWAGSVRYFL
jgi:hypothetical protein